MISIGVVGIGLIGVAALIPLAHHKAEQGVREDRKAAMGKRAFREFRVRGMDRPGTGRAGGNAGSPYWLWPGSPNGDPLSIYDPTGKLVRQSYCLDPMAATAINRFPAGRNGPIPRLSLLSIRPEDVRRTLPANNAAYLLNDPRGLIMTQGQAEEVFRLQDELVFERPDNKNDPPFQVFLENNKRLSAGSFSWMVTAVPDLNPLSDRWTVSVVVFHRRKLTLSPSQEVMAQVLIPTVNGLDTLRNADVKEVFVKEATTTADRDQAGVRHIKNGDWVMLMQQRFFDIDGRFPSYDMKWYRVIAANDLTTEMDTSRELLLSGPDWQASPLRGPLLMVYLRDVVAVYVKTIRMHDSGMHSW